MVEGLEHSNSVVCLVLTGLICKGEDIYAFKKPNVQNKPQEHPTTESQPARPSSGGIVSAFSIAGRASPKDVSYASDGMMKSV